MAVKSPAVGTAVSRGAEVERSFSGSSTEAEIRVPTHPWCGSALATALVLAACGGGHTVPVVGESPTPAFSLCAPSPVDTARGTRVSFGGYSIAVPRGFARRARVGDVLFYESGQQQLSVVATTDAHLFASTGATPASQRTLETCNATIDGVPAEVAMLSVHMPAEMVGDLRAGGRYVVAARFRATAHGRDLVAYFGAVDRRAVERNAGLLWTVRFDRRAAPPS